MGQPFDNVFKENLEIVGAAFLRSVISLDYAALEEIPDVVQTTR
jgi:hypothetical protein